MEATAVESLLKASEVVAAKKRVLMLTKHFLPHIGGVEIHVHKISKELASRGYDITVCCCNTEDAPELETRDGYLICRVRDLSFLPKEYLYSFNIIHCHDFEQYRDWYRKLWTPTYITFHGYEGHVPPNPWTIRRRQEICEEVSGTIHIGNYLKKWYGTDHKNDVVLLGGVDDPGPFTKTDPQRPFKVAYLGRIAEDKRTDLYQKAAEILGDKIQFSVFSNLPNEQVRSMWMEQDIAFCNGQLSMLEAMACGIPVVALESNDMVKDMLRDFPVLHAWSAETIADMTRNLMIDLSLYQNFSYKGWSFAMDHTWRRAADAYERLWGMCDGQY